MTVGYYEYTEADTRAKLIDEKLHRSGWDEDKIWREYYISRGRIINSDGSRARPRRADYVLFYPNRSGHALAVVEAKKASKDPYAGLEQAKRYAKALDVPFAYSTNGLKIIEYNFFTKQTRELDAFPAPEELWREYSTRKGLDIAARRFQKNPLEVPFYTSDKKPRYYQEVAVRRAIETVLLGRKRLLLTMATGSGKTSLVDSMLFKLGQVDRVGSPENGTSAADWTKEEKAHQITIWAKPFDGVYTAASRKIRRLVMIDTPGFADFIGQMIAAAEITDAALLTVDASSGIQVGTQRAWKVCEKRNLPRGIAITCLDKDDVDGRED